jgi:uncharacterized RDD family membrane protein YckC
MTDLPPPPGGFPPPPPPSTPPGWGQPAPVAPPPPGAPGWGQAPPPPFGGPQGYQPQPAYGPPLANFGERLLAKLLDGLILSIAPFLISMVGVFILVTGPDHLSTCTVTDYSESTYYERTHTEPCSVPDDSTIAAAVLVFLVAGAVLVGEYIYYYRREGRTGLTWGRKAMGIRLVGLHTGQPIGSWQAFGRGMFANYISASVCWLGYLWMLWDPRRQCWHDKVVDSLVIKG